MTIGEVGNHFRTTKKIQYFSHESFMDYDFIIIDLNIFLQVPLDFNSEKFLINRKSDLYEFIKFKTIPIIFFTPTSTEIIINRYNVAEKNKIESFFPTSTFSVQHETGNKIEINSNTVFTFFLKKYQANFNYQASFNSHNGTVIAEIPHKQKPVSFFNQTALFLPNIGSITQLEEHNFLSDLTMLLLEVYVKNIKKDPLPEWANNYLLFNELTIKNEVKKINDEISIKKRILDEKNDELVIISNKKRLFTGTGSDLENEVKEIFQQLNFTILDTEPNRDDLIISYQDKVAVIEIKGVTGSAAEKHATQLEKWISTYRETHENVPKGILIVNSFKDVPLSTRNNASFPDQMLNYSINREHCLISTLQLLGIYLEIKRNPTQKDKLIESLFTTSGVYKGFEDWTKFISVDSAIPKTESKIVEPVSPL